jgi:hypothetical protein
MSVIDNIENKLSSVKEKFKEMANDPYKEMHEERLKMKDKEGKLLYKKQGNDIVPRDKSYVYPGLS